MTRLLAELLVFFVGTLVGNLMSSAAARRRRRGDQAMHFCSWCQHPIPEPDPVRDDPTEHA